MPGAAKWNDISGTAGDEGNYICGDVTRHKTDPRDGVIQMILDNSAGGALNIKLQNAKNGSFFAGPVEVFVNPFGSPTILATEVLPGTEFHVCSSASGIGGPYSGPDLLLRRLVSFLS